RRTVAGSSDPKSTLEPRTGPDVAFRTVQRAYLHSLSGSAGHCCCTSPGEGSRFLPSLSARTRNSPTERRRASRDCRRDGVLLAARGQDSRFHRGNLPIRYCSVLESTPLSGQCSELLSLGRLFRMARPGG